MEIFLLAVLLVLFLLPGLLMSRRQRQQQREIASFQQNLEVGQRVITAGGLHGSVVAVTEKDVELEIAPGTVAVFDKLGILRSAEG
ncbi:MAG: preprotein translocase subunit YajC [Corynebacterium sp.]|nr:preprotein translocase subunit YajC [Corynebacterium sp.]